MGYSATGQGIWQTDWTITWTGFGSAPTSVTARYVKNGNTCTVYFTATPGTSNTTAMTITLPFAAANTVGQTFLVRGADNSAFLASPSRVVTRANSNVADCYISSAATAWTASGTKVVQGSFTYETA